MDGDIKKIIKKFYNDICKEYFNNQNVYSFTEILENPNKCGYGVFRFTNELKKINNEYPILIGIGGYLIISFEYFFILELDGLFKIKSTRYRFKDLKYLEWKPYKGFFNSSYGQIKFKGKKIAFNLNKDETIVDILKNLIERYYIIEISIDEIKKIKKRKLLDEFAEKEREKKKLQKEKKIKFEKSKLLTINQLDKDGNGQVDLVDGESFNKLLNKHQNLIIGIDKIYIQKFVKISVYLKNKEINTQKIFELIKETKNESELTELLSLLKNQIHTYELLVFHSISMITTLVESEFITFYEIYETLDQLGIFNSNWENEISNKLIDIGDGIVELMYSINKMEDNIVKTLKQKRFFIGGYFNQLQSSIEQQLNSIDSSLKFNNLLTSIQTYQMYKINQNINITN